MEIKLEVGKRYRKTKEVKITSYCEDENCYKGDDDYLYHSNGKVWSGFYDPIPLTDIIGPAIEEPTPQNFKDTIHPNNWKIPEIDPNDRAVELGWYVAGEEPVVLQSRLHYTDEPGELFINNGKEWKAMVQPPKYDARAHKKMLEETKAWGGPYPRESSPTTEKSSSVESSSNPLQLKPGDVLTDKDGREWVVDRPIHNVAWGEEGWLQSYALKPKPRRLKGIINVYDNEGYVWCERIEVADHDDEKYLVARINLDQFEEGEGL